MSLARYCWLVLFCTPLFLYLRLVSQWVYAGLHSPNFVNVILALILLAVVGFGLGLATLSAVAYTKYSDKRTSTKNERQNVGNE